MIVAYLYTCIPKVPYKIVLVLQISEANICEKNRLCDFTQILALFIIESYNFSHTNIETVYYWNTPTPY